MKKDILAGLIFGGAMLALALAAKYAHARGYVGDDVAMRTLAMNGLLIAYYGNNIPKRVAPHAVARKAQRFSGWTQVLSGLTYAGLWAFAPIPVAETVGTAVVLAGVVLVLGYCVVLDRGARTGAQG